MNIYFIAETNVLYQSIKIFLSYMNIETNYDDLIKKNPEINYLYPFEEPFGN